MYYDYDYNYDQANDVMVFSKTYCPYCTKAKQALSELGVTFNVIELDVSMNFDCIAATTLFNHDSIILSFQYVTFTTFLC